MQIIIKGRHGLEVTDHLKMYIEEKVSRVISDLVSPTICEVMLAETNARDALDKIVHITVSSPHVKNPVYVETKAKEFFSAIDEAADKLARALHNAKR